MAYSIPNLKDVFGHNLKELLIKRDMNQKELANLIGAHENSISMYVKGIRIPPFETVYKIASALSCSIDALTGIDTFSGAELVSETDVWVEKITPIVVEGKLYKAYTHDRSTIKESALDNPKSELYDFSKNIKNAKATNLYALRLSEYSDVLKAPAGALVIIEDITHQKYKTDPRDLRYVVLHEDFEYKENEKDKDTKWITTTYITELIVTDNCGNVHEHKLRGQNLERYIEYFSPTAGRRCRDYYVDVTNKMSGIVRKVIIDY